MNMMIAKKIYNLIPSDKRRGLPLMLLTALCSAVIDLVGIAALVSVLLVVLDENFLVNTPIFAAIYNAVGFTSERAFIVAVCGAVLLLIALKGVCSVALGQVRELSLARVALCALPPHHHPNRQRQRYVPPLCQRHR